MVLFDELHSMIDFDFFHCFLRTTMVYRRRRMTSDYRCCCFHFFFSYYYYYYFDLLHRKLYKYLCFLQNSTWLIYLLVLRKIYSNFSRTNGKKIISRLTQLEDYLALKRLTFAWLWHLMQVSMRCLLWLYCSFFETRIWSK